MNTVHICIYIYTQTSENWLMGYVNWIIGYDIGRNSDGASVNNK